MKPSTEMFPMSSPDINEDDVAAVAEVVRSGRLALGPATLAFEDGIRQLAGTRHAVAVSSGTAALHLIVRALGIGPGDEVLLPSFTFAASANAVLFEGATPVFVDIEPDTYNLSPADVARRITSRTRAIMAVDVFGHPVDWDGLLDVAARHNLPVIDDSCEAIGATYHGKPMGQFGAAAAFAFYPNKQITTGEGGVITTDDDEIARLARSYRNQGRDEMGTWLSHARLGYNYRMDEMSAALGVSQLRRLDQFLHMRAQVARRYTDLLAAVDGVHPPAVRADDVTMSWFVYVITLDTGIPRDAVIDGLADRNIPSRAYFEPLHRQPYLTPYMETTPDLPVTDSIAGRTLALPFHNNLSDETALAVVENLVHVLDSIR